MSELDEVTDAPFPELDAERRHLAFARASRDAMIDRLEAVDPSAAADEITSEYVEVTVAEALDSLRSPGAGDFFGRIDEPSTSVPGELDRWYIGRRHIETNDHDPVVVDWRAPISAAFYRATAIDSLGLEFRRRFAAVDGEITGYLDEDFTDDQDSSGAAAGVPDPVLAEIGAARSGAMREIVATIQSEQDIVIRAPIDEPLIVQGGPGTGKTAVALHRAAYLLFEHRARLARDGVLVVGPNRAFLDYISNVLPSLGERSVRQCTALDLCVPKLDAEVMTGVDAPSDARWKGDAERLLELEFQALLSIQPPAEDVRVPIGTRTHVFNPDQFTDWIQTATSGTVPVNKRRDRLRALAREELRRRCGGDDRWDEAAPLKKAINACWPTQQPKRLVDQYLADNGFLPKGKRRKWTPADQYLVDEANSLLDGTPFRYGHVVVDEAQDHSAVALRAIGRRSIKGSCTLVGDVAQSTTPAGQQRWSEVFGHLDPAADGVGTVAALTIGYRVPEPILEVANRLLPLTGVDASPSSSVRVDGSPPHIELVEDPGIAEAVADAVVRSVVELRRRHRLTGVVAERQMHGALATALAGADLRMVGHIHELDADDVPVFSAEAVKGLEFDGVVVAEPADLLDGSGRGARLLYVAMTRAVQELVFVSTRELPSVIAPSVI